MSPVTAIGWARLAARCACVLLCLALSTSARAGILASATRVVYGEGDRAHSLMLANTNDYPVLVQAWVDDGSGQPGSIRSPFVVLPAVFRLDPGARQGIRLLRHADALPVDRETVFWLNLHEIPAVPVQDAGEARLVLALDTQLKVFHRPRGLGPPPDQLAARLRFSLVRENGQLRLVCHNPTPYHASFAALALLVAGQAHPVQPQPDMMAPPFGSHAYLPAMTVPSTAAVRVRFTLLDDAGHPREHEAALSGI